MKCPKCDSYQLVVVDSRPAGVTVKRRRACVVCNCRFNTYEVTEEDLSKMTDWDTVDSIVDRILNKKF